MYKQERGLESDFTEPFSRGKKYHIIPQLPLTFSKILRNFLAVGTCSLTVHLSSLMTFMHTVFCSFLRLECF